MYRRGEDIFRTINAGYREHWLQAVDSGFLAQTTAAGQTVAFSETTPHPGSWKTLSVQKIPFISYPYEWCFSQLRDAALLTLRLLDQALDNNLILKDASAFNVQFIGTKPVFIDLLSFEKRQPDKPWQAYRQFCMHFLAPLALQAMVDLRCGVMSKLWVGGIPLDLAARMLPWSARLRFGLLLHLILHAGMERKHGDARRSAAKARAVISHGRRVRNLDLPVVGVMVLLQA